MESYYSTIKYLKGFAQLNNKGLKPTNQAHFTIGSGINNTSALSDSFVC